MNNILVIEVKTRNIDRFLNNLYKLNIDIYNVNVINYKEVIIEINELDYNKVKRLSILNKLKVIDYKGRIKRRKIFLYNKTLIFSIFIGIILLILLSNIVFSIDIYHSSNKLREYLLSELNKNGIHKLQFVKNYHDLEKIKNKILNDNKDKIEWLEINRVGTKYIVKVEDRKINNLSTDYKYQDIIATKDGVIKKIVANNGMKIHEINEYVRKGETIISGNIYLNDKLRSKVKATGSVYAEVWYKLSIEYPIINDYKEETGNRLNTYTINIFNNSINLSKNKYKNYNINKKYILKNHIIPISISYDTIYELKGVSGIYTEAEALLNAKAYARGKIEETLKKDEYIISDKVLNYRENRNTIYIDIFYKVYQNITGTREILEDKGGS